jgi:hypothetical protein
VRELALLQSQMLEVGLGVTLLDRARVTSVEEQSGTRVCVCG